MNEIINKSTDYISESSIGLLITVDIEKRPQSRYIGPFINYGLNVVFTTSKESKKIAEIRDNEYVSLYFSNGDKKSVQINGNAEIVENTNEVNDYIERMSEKSEGTKKWLNSKDFEKYCFIKIITSNVQYTDLANTMKTIRIDI